MQRYAAFLRGVSPMNCKMPELAKAFAGAGFRDVRTLLSSGNVVFTAARGTEATIRRKAETAMLEHLGTAFTTFLRPVDELAALVAGDPFAPHRVPAHAKRVVTFLHAAPQAVPKLPIEREGARIVAVAGREVFCAYVPQPNQPVFMALIERTFGKDNTTRTWDTVTKVVKAGLG